MENWSEKNYTRLVEIRRYLHQHPELGFEEYNTTDYLKNLLKQAGYEIIQNEKMTTGFYCEYGSGSNKKLGIRCDLDALPIFDKKEVEYRSKNEGVMHACGHDVHMTIVTGIALWLKDKNIQIPGTVRFIYQPGEEKAPGGSIQMIGAGAIENLNHLIGIHILPSMNAEKIAIKSGPIAAAVSLLQITLYGPGGHTSRPHETIDLISISCDLITTLQDCMKNLQENDSPFVLGLGQIEGGHSFNVIPSKLIIRGSVRYFDAAKKEILHRNIVNTVNKISKKYETQIDIDFPYSVPAVNNDPVFTNIIKSGAAKILGKQNIEILDKSSMGSDDFGFYVDKVPCAYIRIGSSNGKKKDLHVSDFDVDEKCIRTGLKSLAGIIAEYFNIKL